MTYAIYKGDTFLFVGSKKECANYLEVKEDTISYYMTPAYKKRCKDEYINRILVIKVEE